MSRNKPLLILCACAALGVACGTGGDNESAAPPRDTGAGTVLKFDAALDEILPADYKIEKLAGGYGFIEGPVWVTGAGWQGAPFLLFSDVLGNAIYEWEPTDGQVSDFKNPVFEGEFVEGRLIGPNGMTLDKDRNLLVCEHGNRRISKVTPQGEWSTLIDEYEGKKLNSPNDLTFHSNGWLYFTDPPFGLSGQDDNPAKELDFNGIFRLSPDGKTVELLDRRQTRPNGIAFSPDERTMYVSNADPSEKVWTSYQVKEDGTLGLSSKFYDATSETTEGLPDGLKVDKAGRIFATGPGGVWIFSPDGTHLGTIQPAEIPANVAWGGDGKTLYMTARTGLYRIRLNTEGTLP